MSYVVFTDGTARVDGVDLLTILAALRDGAEYRASRSGDDEDLAALASYRLLSMSLGDDREGPGPAPPGRDPGP
jgi:hypothetical protein